MSNTDELEKEIASKLGNAAIDSIVKMMIKHKKIAADFSLSAEDKNILTDEFAKISDTYTFMGLIGQQSISQIFTKLNVAINYLVTGYCLAKNKK